MLKSFPKVLSIGDPKIADLFQAPVFITEKLDGSAFKFGMVGGELVTASKNKIFPANVPEQMFKKAVDYVEAIQGSLIGGYVYYGEYLSRPKHNVLTYSRVPENHIALYAVMRPDGSFVPTDELASLAGVLGVEAVPVYAYESVSSPQTLLSYLGRESFLGGAKIEGVVCHRPGKLFYWQDKEYAITCGKFVSEAFKEKHAADWKKENTGAGKFDVLCASYASEARWRKAIQHLRDSGELEQSPRDIGKLIPEIQRDLLEEERENIKEELFRIFGKDILRHSIKGFPETYKQWLLEDAFV